MRARQILQISGLLLLCLFLLSACDGCGPLDTLRVDSPLDESEITLPIQKGYGQLAGTSAYFRTKQTPRDLYQAYKALEAEKGLRVTPYPAGLLIEQTVGSGARYYWLAATRESTKRGRWYLLSIWRLRLWIEIPGLRRNGRRSRAAMCKRRLQAQ